MAAAQCLCRHFLHKGRGLVYRFLLPTFFGKRGPVWSPVKTSLRVSGKQVF